MNDFTSLKTIVRKEVIRFMRIWTQSFLPPVITISLYFTIFGTLIGQQVAPIAGYGFMQFMAPGLIMMFIINNAYANVVSSFYSTRFMRNVEELLVSPTSNITILLGYVIGGVLRALLVGIIVTIIALFYTELKLTHPFLTLLFILLSAILFALMGFTNAVYARSFDDIMIIPTFVLTPLIYLGGVFYSVDMLPSFWRTISYYNPILYIVNGFRYGVLGVSDVNINSAIAIVLLSIMAFFTFNMYLLNRGIGLRT